MPKVTAAGLDTTGMEMSARSKTKTLRMSPASEREIRDLHQAMFYGDLLDSDVAWWDSGKTGREDPDESFGTIWVKTRMGRFLLTVQKLEWEEIPEEVARKEEAEGPDGEEPWIPEDRLEDPRVDG